MASLVEASSARETKSTGVERVGLICEHVDAGSTNLARSGASRSKRGRGGALEAQRAWSE
jgi:hypothetical protein